MILIVVGAIGTIPKNNENEGLSFVYTFKEKNMSIYTNMQFNIIFLTLVHAVISISTGCPCFVTELSLAL